MPCALFPFLSVSKSWVSPGDSSDQKCQNANAGIKEVISNTSGQLAASSSVCLAIVQYHFPLFKHLTPKLASI